MYYHVWFSTKRRKWLLQGDIHRAVRRLLSEVSVKKGIKLLAYQTVVDHVHLLVEVDKPEELSRTIGLLKGRVALGVFQLFPWLKADAGIEHFWQRSYGSKAIAPEALETVKQYIATQWDRLEKYYAGDG